MKEAGIYNEEKTVSSKSGVGKPDSYEERMKLEHFLTPYTKVNSKWIKRPKCKARHYKTLREKSKS